MMVDVGQKDEFVVVQSVSSETAIPFRDKPEKFVLRTPEEQVAFEKLVEEFRPLDQLGRRKLLAKLEREIKRKKDRLERAKQEEAAHLEFIDLLEAEAYEFEQKLKPPFKMQRPSQGHLREIRQACAHDGAFEFGREFKPVFPYLDYEKEIFRFAESFVIQHDWSKAFEKAKDFDGPFKLPHEVCAFEFQINDVALIVFAAEVGDQIWITPAIRGECKWLLFSWAFCWDSGKWTPNQTEYVISSSLVEFCGEQIRAACIALDAEVATTEVVRLAHDGVRKNSQTPLSSYRVVQLNRRYARLPANPLSEGLGRKKRLHFRRGHWRHYVSFKTWIKWTLVGDPDLGFIDKEYRL